MESKFDDLHYSNKIFKQSLRTIDSTSEASVYNQYNMSKHDENRTLFKKINMEEEINKRNKNIETQVDKNLNRFKPKYNKKDVVVEDDSTEKMKPKNISHLKSTFYQGEQQGQQSLDNNVLTHSEQVKISSLNGTYNFKNLNDKVSPPYSKNKVNAVKGIYNSNSYQQLLDSKLKKVKHDDQKVNHNPVENLKSFESEYNKHSRKFLLKNETVKSNVQKIANTQKRLFG